MSPSLAWIGRAQRRLALGVALTHLRAPLWIAVAVAAAHRFLFRSHALAVALVAVGAAVIFAAWRTLPRLPSREHAAVLVDRSVQAGGLLLTQLERPLGDWEAGLRGSLQRVRLPRVPWGPLASVWNAGALLVLALTLPLPFPEPTVRNAAAAGRLEDLASQLEVLAQESNEEEALREALAELREELAAGQFDAADWEATDALQAKLAAESESAAARLAQAEQASRALEAALANQASAEEIARRQEALEQALTELGQKDGNPTAATGADGGVASGTAARSPAEVRRELEARQERLARATQSPGTGQGTRGQRPGTSPGQGRSPGQSRSPGQGTSPGPGEEPGSSPGQGTKPGGDPTTPGSTPGGGPGTLVFEGPGAENPGRLAFQPLPPGAGDPDQLWGMSAADPRRPQGLAGVGTGTAAAGDQAPAHGSTPLLPRNRALVRRYFGGTSNGR